MYIKEKNSIIRYYFYVKHPKTKQNKTKHKLYKTRWSLTHLAVEARTGSTPLGDVGAHAGLTIENACIPLASCHSIAFLIHMRDPKVPWLLCTNHYTRNA